MAFEEIYSSDASTWHLQFHGNAGTAEGCQNVDVFLSNGVEAARDIDTFDTLYRVQREYRGGLGARGGRRARPHG